MRIYVVFCNGVISGYGYTTLEEAQAYCESRADRPQKVGYGWKYKSRSNTYTITDIFVETEKGAIK
jgi:hypothetical protein